MVRIVASPDDGVLAWWTRMRARSRRIDRRWACLRVLRPPSHAPARGHPSQTARARGSLTPRCRCAVRNRAPRGCPLGSGDDRPASCILPSDRRQFSPTQVLANPIGSSPPAMIRPMPGKTRRLTSSRRRRRNTSGRSTSVGVGRGSDCLSRGVDPAADAAESGQSSRCAATHSN